MGMPENKPRPGGSAPRVRHAYTGPARPGRIADWGRMSKPELIQAIQELNPTADGAFLGRFGPDELAAYHTRLTRLANRRGPDTVWVRRTRDEPRLAPAEAAPRLAA